MAVGHTTRGKKIDGRAMGTASSGASSAVMGTYVRQDIVFARGEGCWLCTPAGEKYLDFGSGVAVNALGHAHPHLIEALTHQARKLWHTSNLYRVEGQEKLARRLTELSFADSAFFCNSGAEACEGAIKTARRYHFVSGRPERFRIITFQGAFHGRTLATLAAGGNDKYLEGFGPKAEGFDQVPFDDVEAVKAAIGPQTAAIMVEPIQGEGGVRSFRPESLKAMRNLCDAHGLLLIYDEVQCGMGRTGKLFAHEWAGFAPDIMALAKGLGGGFPIGAFLANAEVTKGMTPGTHGSTFGGNPLATAVANAVLDVVAQPAFLADICTKSLHLKQHLAQLKDQFPHLIAEVRGKGLLTGLKFKSEIEPPAVVKAALEEQLLLVGAGDNTVRVIPPLTVSEEELREGTERIARALQKISIKHAP